MTTSHTLTFSALKPLAFATITTKFIGPTDTKGSRIKATCQAKSITRSWDYALNADENHRAVAGELAQLVGWNGNWRMGADAGDGYVFVCGEQPAFTIAAV
jgi:hypothetical protein